MKTKEEIMEMFDAAYYELKNRTFTEEEENNRVYLLIELMVLYEILGDDVPSELRNKVEYLIWEE